jgi:muconolactone delta-isomerase
MQFLTISRRKASTRTPAGLAGEESQIAQALYSKGSIRQIWHRGDIPGACILWEAESEEEVRELIRQLPFARAELIEVSIVPLRPYAGFITGRQESIASVGPGNELRRRDGY